MASHHGCHQHQQQQTHHHHHQSTCCCSCSSPQLPQLSPTDPLLQAIATQLLHQTQQHRLYGQPQPHHQNHHKTQTHHPLHHEQQKPQSQALYTSLLRRITALESSLHHLSSSPPPPFSLKDHAARAIQTHFRAYLVRRSQTLRNLKHLAIIKTTFNSLKSSISNKPHFNPDLVSQKAMDLLHKLDSIQGGDPMIRDGKRSMSRELVQILEFIEGVLMKRRQLYSKTRKNVRFAEDAKRSRVHKTPHKHFIGEDDARLDDQGVSSDDQTEVLENLCRKIENIEGFSRVYEEDEDESQIGSEAPSSEVSNGERNPKMNMKSKGSQGDTSHLQGQNGNSMFCPPLPVQMESTRDDQKMKKEKIVRVVR